MRAVRCNRGVAMCILLNLWSCTALHLRSPLARLQVQLSFVASLQRTMTPRAISSDMCCTT